MAIMPDQESPSTTALENGGATTRKSTRLSSSFPELVRIRNVGETERMQTPPKANGSSKKLASSSPAASGTRPSTAEPDGDLAQTDSAEPHAEGDEGTLDAYAIALEEGAASSEILGSAAAASESLGGPSLENDERGECAPDVGQQAPVPQGRKHPRPKMLAVSVEISVPPKRTTRRSASASSSTAPAQPAASSTTGAASPSASTKVYEFDFVDVPYVPWAREHITRLRQADEAQKKITRRRSSGGKSVRWAASEQSEARRASTRIKTPAASKDPWAGTPESPKKSRSRGKSMKSSSLPPSSSPSTSAQASGSSARRKSKQPAGDSEEASPVDDQDLDVDMDDNEDVDMDPLPQSVPPTVPYVYPLTARLPPNFFPSFNPSAPGPPLGSLGPIFPPPFAAGFPAMPSASTSEQVPGLSLPSLPPTIIPSFAFPIQGIFPVQHFLPFDSGPAAVLANMLLPPHLRPDQTMHQVITENSPPRATTQVEEAEPAAAQSPRQAISEEVGEGSGTQQVERAEPPEHEANEAENTKTVDTATDETLATQDTEDLMTEPVETVETVVETTVTTTVETTVVEMAPALVVGLENAGAVTDEALETEQRETVQTTIETTVVETSTGPAVELENVEGTIQEAPEAEQSETVETAVIESSSLTLEPVSESTPVVPDAAAAVPTVADRAASVAVDKLFEEEPMAGHTQGIEDVAGPSSAVGTEPTTIAAPSEGEPHGSAMEENGNPSTLGQTDLDSIGPPPLFLSVSAPQVPQPATLDEDIDMVEASIDAALAGASADNTMDVDFAVSTQEQSETVVLLDGAVANISEDQNELNIYSDMDLLPDDLLDSAPVVHAESSPTVLSDILLEEMKEMEMDEGAVNIVGETNSEAQLVDMETSVVAENHVD